MERIVERPLRRRLPDTRHATTHKFDVAGHEGYITVGLYEDGSPGEIFIRMAKEGSTIGGLMDTIATLVSVSLQYGVPVESLVRKFEHVRFEPSGMTRNPEIPFAKSLVDYIFRWLAMEFVPGYREANAPRPRTALAQPSNPEPRPPRSPNPKPNPNPARTGEKRRQRSRPPHAPRQLPHLRLHRRRNQDRRDHASARARPRLESSPGRRRRSPQPTRLRNAGRRPRLRRLRQHHRPQRYLLQVPQLWKLHGLQLISDARQSNTKRWALQTGGPFLHDRRSPAIPSNLNDRSQQSLDRAFSASPSPI